MTKKRPLVVVDDDVEDQELVMTALEDLGFNYDVRFFQSAEAALDYLNDSPEQPFMIVSDINMPRMDGITFKRTIESSTALKAKAIPFIFLTTSTRFVHETSDLNIQGYFEKGNSLEHLNETLNIILTYWGRTKHLN